MSKFPLDLKQFKKAASDKHSTTLRHRSGHEIKVVHSALSPEHRQLVHSLPSVESELPPTPVKMAIPKKEIASEDWSGTVARKRYAIGGGVSPTPAAQMVNQEPEDVDQAVDQAEAPVVAAENKVVETPVAPVVEPVVEPAATPVATPTPASPTPAPVSTSSEAVETPKQKVAPSATPTFVYDMIAKQESNHNQFNKDGTVLKSTPKDPKKPPAYGKYQLQEKTAEGAAKRLGIPFDRELFFASRTGDPAKDKAAEDYNAMLGKSEIDAQWKNAKGDPAHFMSYYNYGIGNTGKLKEQHGEDWQNNLPDETKAYIAKNLPAFEGSAEVLTTEALGEQAEEEEQTEPSATENQQASSALELPPEEVALRQKLYDDTYKNILKSNDFTPQQAEDYALHAVKIRAKKYNPKAAQGAAQIASHLAQKDLDEKNKKRQAVGLPPLAAPKTPEAPGGPQSTPTGPDANPAGMAGAASPTVGGAAAGNDISSARQAQIAGFNQQSDAAQNVARAEALEAEQRGGIASYLSNEAIKLVEQQDEAAKSFATASQRIIDDIDNGKLQKVQIFADRSTPSKILGIIGLMLGGMSQGLMRSKTNPAMDALNTTIDNEIKKQTSQLGSAKGLLDAYVKKYENLALAQDRLKSFLLMFADHEAQKQAQKTNSVKAIEKANDFSGQLSIKTGELLNSTAMNAMLFDSMKQGQSTPNKPLTPEQRDAAQDAALKRLSLMSQIDPAKFGPAFERLSGQTVRGYDTAPAPVPNEVKKELGAMNNFKMQVSKYKSFVEENGAAGRTVNPADIAAAKIIVNAVKSSYAQAYGLPSTDAEVNRLDQMIPKLNTPWAGIVVPPVAKILLDEIRFKAKSIEDTWGLKNGPDQVTQIPLNKGKK